MTKIAGMYTIANICPICKKDIVGLGVTSTLGVCCCIECSYTLATGLTKNVDEIYKEMSTDLKITGILELAKKIKPLNIFEQFKENWFPNWLLTKFPVKYFIDW